jgi:hypothetical protein
MGARCKKQLCRRARPPERIDEVRRILLETNRDDVRVEPGSPVIPASNTTSDRT